MQYLRGNNILQDILGKIKVGTSMFVDRYKNVIYDNDNEYVPTHPPTTTTPPPTTATIKTTVITSSTSSQP